MPSSANVLPVESPNIRPWTMSSQGHLCVPVTKEPIGLTRQDGKRPDGLTLIPWQRERPLTWDVTIAHTLAGSCVSVAARSGGAAAEQAACRGSQPNTTSFLFIIISLQFFAWFAHPCPTSLPGGTGKLTAGSGWTCFGVRVNRTLDYLNMNLTTGYRAPYDHKARSSQTDRHTDGRTDKHHGNSVTFRSNQRIAR